MFFPLVPVTPSGEPWRGGGLAQDTDPPPPIQGVSAAAGGFRARLGGAGGGGGGCSQASHSFPPRLLYLRGTSKA